MKKVIYISLLFLVACSPKTEEKEVESNFDNVKVYDFVSDMPMYEGGDDALYRFIENELQYPEQYKKDGIEAVALVSFIIDSTGVIHQAKVENTIDKPFEEEALRIIAKMPNWQAGLENGKPVNVRYVLPIEFELKK
jgi:protein TonB